MNNISLSDVATWGDKRLAIEISQDLALQGVELTPFRYFDKRLAETATSLHSSPFVNWESLFDRLKYGPRNEASFFLMMKLFAGDLWVNPALRIAKERNIPIVIHHDNALEMLYAGMLDALKGVRVLVENTNFINHPLIGEDWEGSFLHTIEEARRVLPDLGVVIDFEHLAMNRWPAPSDLANFVGRVSERGPIEEFHVCDSIPGEPFKGHLVPGNGSMPLVEQLQLIGGQFPEALVVMEHLPTIGKLPFLLSSRHRRYTACARDARQALSLIKEALLPVWF